MKEGSELDIEDQRNLDALNDYTQRTKSSIDKQLRSSLGLERLRQVRPALIAQAEAAHAQNQVEPKLRRTDTYTSSCTCSSMQSDMPHSDSSNCSKERDTLEGKEED